MFWAALITNLIFVSSYVGQVLLFPNFHPGMEDGEKMEIRFNLPFNFDMRKLFEGWLKKK